MSEHDQDVQNASSNVKRKPCPETGQARNHVHTHQKRRAITNRLSRIEGHIRSIKAMVDEGRDCPEILQQIAAVKSAIDQTGRVVLEDHLESCLFHVGVSPEINEVWLGVKESLDAIF